MEVKVKRLAIVFILFVTTAFALEPPADKFQLHTQIGRFGAINLQSRAAMDFIREATPPVASTDEWMYKPPALYAQLYHAVLDYNLVQGQACFTGLVEGELCAAPFFPGWLVVPGKATYSYQQLQAMTDEFHAAIVPLWGALCEAARAKGADETFCAME